MSFEEKKTLAWNQEQHRKWNSSGQGDHLVPLRDATSSLINSNLQGLSTSKALDSLSSLPLSTSYIPNNWAPNCGPPQQPMSLVGTYPSMATSPPQPTHLQHQSSMSSNSLDLKSLDSLLPNIGSKSNLTLSQMSQGIRNPGVRNVELPSSPVLPLNNFIKPSPVNSAKNELEDLLG